MAARACLQTHLHSGGPALADQKAGGREADIVMDGHAGHSSSPLCCAMPEDRDGVAADMALEVGDLAVCSRDCPEDPAPKMDYLARVGIEAVVAFVHVALARKSDSLAVVVVELALFTSLHSIIVDDHSFPRVVPAVVLAMAG